MKRERPTTYVSPITLLLDTSNVKLSTFSSGERWGPEEGVVVGGGIIEIHWNIKDKQRIYGIMMQSTLSLVKTIFFFENSRFHKIHHS